MSKVKKICLIVAAACSTTGILLIGVAFGLSKLNKTKVTTSYCENKTYPVTSSFRSLDIQTVDSPVLFALSDQRDCRVVCKETADVSYSVTVKNDTLSVIRSDHRQWFERFLPFFRHDSLDVTIFLPQNEYDHLSVVSVSGNITVPEVFSFKTANVKSVSGSIHSDATVSSRLKAKTTSGEIEVSHVTGGSLSVKTVSGTQKLASLRVTDASCHSVSGDICLNDAVMSGNFTGDSTSGSVLLNACDASQLTIKTISGEVSGSLLRHKRFFTKTVSGSISVPENSPADSGKCEICTTSGDIRFTILPG